jgi:hypothetical protein
MLKGAFLALEVPEVLVRHVWDGAPPGLRGAHAHQPVGFIERQRPEEHTVDDAEKRRAGADAERHRQDEDARQERRSAHQA